MPNSMTIAGMDASNSGIGYSVPVSRGLLDFRLLGNSLAGSNKNLAPGGVSGAASQYPIIGSGYVGGLFPVTAVFTGSITTNQLTVSTITSGTIKIGSTITSGAAAGTTITGFVSGTLGGVGVYTVNNSQTVASGTNFSAAAGGYVGAAVGDNNSSSFTIVSVHRAAVLPTGTADGVIAWGSLSANTGLNSYCIGGNWNCSAYCIPAGGGTQVLKSSGIAGATTSYSMYAVQMDGVNLTIQQMNLSTGASGPLTSTGGAFVPSGQTIRIGSAPNQSTVSYPNECDVAFWAYHNVVLTSSELTTIYAQMKNVLTARGIPVA